MSKKAWSCYNDGEEGYSRPISCTTWNNILTPYHASLENFKPSNVSKNLVEIYQKYGQPCASVFDVGAERVSNYGIVSHSGMITSIVEKPLFEDAPSTYALCGRYIYSENTFELLDKYSVEEFGELQSMNIASLDE